MHSKQKDIIIYDAGCGFCQRSVDILKKILGEKIEYKASYEVGEGFYNLTQNSFGSSIKFVEHQIEPKSFNEYEKIQNYAYHDVHEDAIIYHGAYAIFKALNYNVVFSPLLFLYRWFPFFSTISEAAYRMIARNRMHISKAIGADSCKIN